MSGVVGRYLLIIGQGETQILQFAVNKADVAIEWPVHAEVWPSWGPAELSWPDRATTARVPCRVTSQ